MASIKLTTEDLQNIVKKVVTESLSNDSHDIIDVVIMLKEAYADIQEYTEANRSAALDLSEALGNIRNAIKTLGNYA